MTCRISGGLAVCGPPPGVYHRRFLDCGQCKRRHGFIVQWDGAWYGTTLYGSCGDRWQDGEMGSRPFRRGWRTEAKRDFSAMWQNAATRAQYQAYVEADTRFALSDEDDWETTASQRDAALEVILGGAS